MKRFSEQFYTKAQSVKLQAVEREELRNRVLSYMEYHPIEGTVTNQGKKVVAGSQFRYIRFPFGTIAKASTAMAAFVLVAVPVMAEQSVPGDKLFAVKVGFNEELISTLKISPYEKVEWETERLNRRIAEARLLANEGKLTEEVEAEIVAAVQEHTESVEAGIEEIRADDADQAVLASIELNTTLQMQSEALQGEDATVLAMATSEMASDGGPTQKLAEVLTERLSKQDSATDISAIPPYEKIMARVELNTTRAYELLESRKNSIDEKKKQDITRRLEDVNRTIDRANSMRESNGDEASGALLDALQRTKKIIVFMSAEGVASDIETVIPVEYTDEEYRQQLVVLNEDVNRKIEMITTLNPYASVGASEKALYAVAIAKSNQEIIASSTEAVSAVHLAKESIAVLNDALGVFEGEGVTADIVAAPDTTDETATTTEPVVEEDNSQSN